MIDINCKILLGHVATFSRLRLLNDLLHAEHRIGGELGFLTVIIKSNTSKTFNLLRRHLFTSTDGLVHLRTLADGASLLREPAETVVAAGTVDRDEDGTLNLGKVMTKSVAVELRKVTHELDL